MLLRIGSLLASVCLSVLLVGVVAQLGSSEAEAQSDQFQYAVKMHPEFFFYDDPNLPREKELDKALDMAKAAGINTIDSDVIWKALDQGDWGGKPRTYDWAHLDRMVAEVEERGMTLNFHINSTPDWVHPYLMETTPNPEDRKWYAPRGAQELQHWSNFVHDLAARYEGRVNHYEIWNEPNHQPFWHSGPKASEYAPFLRAGYLGIKAEDPNADVVFGGMALSNLGYLDSYYTYVKNQYPDAEKNNYYFDVLGVHPYSQHRSPDMYTNDAICKPDSTGKSTCDSARFVGEVDNNYLGFKRMKQLMDQREGTSGKKLYFGEMGYSTAPTDPITDAQRAFFLKRAYEIARETPYVQGMAWYAFHDKIQAADHPKWTLLAPDYTPTKTYRAYKQVTGSEASSVRVTLKAGQALSEGKIVYPDVSGIASGGIRNWELYENGAMIRKQEGSQPVSISGSAGSDLRAVVYTTDGSVWYSKAAELSEHAGEQQEVPQEEPSEPPKITSLKPGRGATIKDRTPTIRAEIKPLGNNIVRSDIQLYVDGKRRTSFDYDRDSGTISRTTGRLAYGRHVVRVTVNHDSGNPVIARWSFRVVR